MGGTQIRNSGHVLRLDRGVGGKWGIPEQKLVGRSHAGEQARNAGAGTEQVHGQFLLEKASLQGEMPRTVLFVKARLCRDCTRAYIAFACGSSPAVSGFAPTVLFLCHGVLL